MFRFERLEVWRKAVDFADLVYAVTRTFPGEERFGLTSQMRRASVSISSNIAEGTGRSTGRDFAHFIEIAYGSLMEVVSQLRIAQKQSFVEKQDNESLCNMAEELARMLSGLRTSLKRAKPTNQKD